MNEASQHDDQAGKPGTLDAITRADQAAWEAPPLRQVFTPDTEREPWAHPCPDWCTQDNPGHDVTETAYGVRTHRSALLRVRMDGAKAYDSEEGDVSGMMAAHIEAALIAGSRDPDRPRIQLVARFGDGGGREKVWRLSGLFPDEARELIAVLQHLLKVGQV